MIAGVSARLPVDEAYRGFLDLVAAAVRAALANARAYEEERAKSEALPAARSRQDGVFCQREPRVSHPAHLDPRPTGGQLAERESPLPPPRRERLATAHRSSLRLLKLVNTLLNFSRMGAGRAEAAYEPTNLAADTVDLANVFRPAVERAGLTLVIDCPPLPEPVYVDRDMWERNRPQPSLERSKAHVRGLHHRPLAVARGPLCAIGDGHRHRHQPHRASAPLRAFPPGPGRQVTLA